MTNNDLMGIEQAYRAAHNGVVCVDLGGYGRLIATERDRLDLLHRLSTNNLNKLQRGQLAPTVFTTPNARIIDYVTVLHRGENALIVTGEGRAELMLNWLRRNVFFNDKFQVEDASSELRQIGVFGSDAGQRMAEIWPDVNNLERGHFVDINGLLVARVNQIAGDGFWLIGSNDVIQAVQDQLTAHNIGQAALDLYDALRIEAGVPSARNELTDHYIPLELGLWDAVSFNKGCYTGQEIIARMESRGKLAKLLVRISLKSSVSAGTSLVDPDGKSAGTLTSVAEPIPGQVIGLAVVKADYASPEQQLLATISEDNHVSLTVMGLAGQYAASYD